MSERTAVTSGLTRVLLALVTLPPTLAHEATHAVLAAPWAQELALVVDPQGMDAAVGIDWTEDVPSWAVTLAHYGPFVVGCGLGLGAVLWVIQTGTLPSSPRGWLSAGILGVWWTIFTAPSPDDRD